ncbi:MAG TPA: DUF342 domain-containing protein [candidate division Zixibacteria bacterium]|nr:DUF342 domain-containing protein [candidate division Zixibacteria bacterium]
MMEDTKTQNNREVEAVFDLKVTEDKLAVLLSCPSVIGNVETFAEQVLGRLEEINVKIKPDVEALLKVLKEAQSQGKDIVEYTLIKGVPPIMPVHGKIEWSDDYFNEEYYIDPETKRIDFHRRLGDPNVEKDVLLVKVTREKHGKNGRDVFGRIITVPRAKKVYLQGGSNVLWDEKAGGFVSKTAGRVVKRGHTVDIDETMFIKEGIGIETGNIVHKGSIVVNGDIDSELSVDVSGDIEVRGLIYACDIKCGGNLTCKEGINENTAKKIEVKGDILAKYIMNASIETYGQIVANREIFQSKIKSKNEIHCKKGRVLGGEIMAAKGIYVGEAGSKGNAKTLLIAGIDFQLQNKLKINDENIKKLKDALKKLKPVHKKLSNMRNYLKADQKEKLTELEFKISETEYGIKSLEAESKEIRKEIYSNKKARIVIYDLVYPGVVLRVFDSQYIVENALAGPVVAEIDPITGEIALSSDLNEEKE